MGILNFFEISLFTESKSARLFNRDNSLSILFSIFFSMDKDFAQYLIIKTRDDYNLISDDFSSKRSGVWQEIVFLFNNHLEKGDKALDLGCGNGRFYPLFKEKKVKYIGVDNSEKLITIAKNKYNRKDFKVANGFSLPFKENYFDKVFSIAVLHHIPSQDLRIKFLKEAKRVLKNKGILVLTVWKFHQLREYGYLFKYTILKLIGKFYSKNNQWAKLDLKDIFEPWGKTAQRYYHWFSKKELEGLAKKAGFKIIDSGDTKNEKGNRQNFYIVLQK